MCLRRLWHRLVSWWLKFRHQPIVISLTIPAFVLAAGICAVLAVLFLASFAWWGSDHGVKVREVVDSLLPLFKFHTDLAQFLVQATLGVLATVILALVFVLLYNSLLSILGEED